MKQLAIGACADFVSVTFTSKLSQSSSPTSAGCPQPFVLPGNALLQCEASGRATTSLTLARGSCGSASDPFAPPQPVGFALAPPTLCSTRYPRPCDSTEFPRPTGSSLARITLLPPPTCEPSATLRLSTPTVSASFPLARPLSHRLHLSPCALWLHLEHPSLHHRLGLQSLRCHPSALRLPGLHF